MTTLTHEQLVGAFGFARLINEPGWQPAEQHVQRLLYTALRRNSIDGADALALLQTCPAHIEQVLSLLDDSDLRAVHTVACGIVPLTALLSQSQLLLKSWCAKQIALKLTHQRLQKAGQDGENIDTSDCTERSCRDQAPY